MGDVTGTIFSTGKIFIFAIYVTEIHYDWFCWSICKFKQKKIIMVINI